MYALPRNAARPEHALLIRQHPLAAFFVLAYAISWAIALPLVAARLGLLCVPFALHYLTAYGPMLATLLVTRMTEGLPDYATCAGGCFSGGLAQTGCWWGRALPTGAVRAIARGRGPLRWGVAPHARLGG